MYKVPKFQKAQIKQNKSIEGESIEQKVDRIVNNKEPIKDGAPLIFTERKEGVKQAYNMRTDRFEVAIDAMSKVEKSYKAKREDRIKPKNDGGAEPTQGKDQGSTDGNLRVV